MASSRDKNSHSDFLELSVADTGLSSRRLLVWMLRIVALLLVAWGVGGSVRTGLVELSKHQWSVDPVWLAAAGALYAIGLMPMGWFWRQTLVALKHPAPLLPTLRAYFLGHVAKYVPGKAMTVILRVAAVRKWVPSMRIALVSTFLETLTMMAAGAFLAAVISAFVLHMQPLVSLGALAMACVAGVPTIPPVARLLASLGSERGKGYTGRQNAPDASLASATTDVTANLQGINFLLLATGWIAATFCWLLLGASLWATLRAIGVDNIDPFGDLPRLVTAGTFAVVAGFLSQLPAGLIVRDAVLVELLAPFCGNANALVAAVLMRLVWLVSEVTVCGILYIGVGSKPNHK
jgi:uncharacterized membrane protein YbhN (UPF0104 family)